MYELKKLFYNKRNAGVFVFLIFFLICFVDYNIYMDMHYNESQIKIFQKANRKAESNLLSFVSDEESEFWKNINLTSNRLIKLYWNQKNQTEEFINTKIKWNTLMIQANMNGYVVNDFEKRDVQTLQNENKQLKYLNKNHIEMLNSPYEPNTWNLLNELFGQKLYLILLLIICVLLCDVFGLEMENGFYKNLYVSQISKKKIWIHKIEFSVIVAIIALFISLLILGLSGFIFGFGNSQYPYFYFNQMFTIKEIVTQSLSLLIVETLFLVGISSLWFSLSISSGFILTMNLILYALFFVLGNLIGYSKLFAYIPFLHTDFIQLIIHKKVIISMFVSLFYSVIFSFISMQYFNKRELVK